MQCRRRQSITIAVPAGHVTPERKPTLRKVINRTYNQLHFRLKTLPLCSSSSMSNGCARTYDRAKSLPPPPPLRRRAYTSYWIFILTSDLTALGASFCSGGGRAPVPPPWLWQALNPKFLGPRCCCNGECLFFVPPLCTLTAWVTQRMLQNATK